MSVDYEVAVIGGGVIGASVFAALCQSGRKTVLLEQQRIASGATLYSGGFVRAFHQQQQWLSWACESLAYFQRQAMETGFEAIGSTFVPSCQNAETLRTWVQRQQSLGQPCELIDSARFRALHPGFRVDSEALAIHEPQAGFADPILTARHFVALGECHGGTRIEGLKVDAVQADEERGVKITTAAAKPRLSVQQAVLCTGAWTERLLGPGPTRSMGLRSKAIQADIFAEPFTGNRQPALLVENSGVFTRAINRHQRLFGVPLYEWDIDPDQPPRLHSQHSDHARCVARALSPAGHWRHQGARLGFDSYTEQTAGLVRWSQPGKVLVCAGWSGAGFKVAPAIGGEVCRRLASLGNECKKSLSGVNECL